MTDQLWSFIDEGHGEQCPKCDDDLVLESRAPGERRCFVCGHRWDVLQELGEALLDQWCGA